MMKFSKFQSIFCPSSIFRRCYVIAEFDYRLCYKLYISSMKLFCFSNVATLLLARLKQSFADFVCLMATIEQGEAVNATFMATTPGPSVQEPLEDGTATKVRKRKVKAPSVQESLLSLQTAMEKLEKQVASLSLQRESGPSSLLENKLVMHAQKRLRFDIKDVHGSIKTWDHFFCLYGIDSDYEKFFAVEQLLPMHVQKAMASNMQLETSYNWLKYYLTEKYDPKFQCHEMSGRTVSRSTNLNDLENLATEAADCPKEHLTKHFMLEACPFHVRQRMKPYLMLSMKEFKLRLGMMIQEDGQRANGQTSNNRNGNKINALQQEVESSAHQEALDQNQTPSNVREFRRNPASQGNGRT